LEGDLARRGRVIGEWSEATVVSSAKRGERQLRRRHQNPVADSFRCLDRWVDGVGDTDEDDLFRLPVLANDVEHAPWLSLTRKLDVEASRSQPEQCRQQARVVDTGAVCGI